MANRVFVFVPAFGQTIQATTFLTTHALMGQLAAKGIGAGISTLSFPDIAELRNMALTIWYDTLPDVSHLLFIDADMGFPSEMVFDMLAFGEPIVGSIYPQRRLPITWAGSGSGDTHSERRGNFMRVEGVGMGCTLIARTAIDKMLEVFPEMVDTRLELHPAAQMLQQTGTKRMIRCFDKIDIPDRGQVSEDLSFCLRWGKCGGQVWGAIGYKMSHVGPFDYCGRYLDMVEAQEAQVAQLQAQGIDPATTTWIGDPITGHAEVAALPVTNGGTTVVESLEALVSRGRGRPKGSKNKKKSYPQDKRVAA
jgi:hypothetical protein